MSKRPDYCCGKCPELARGGYDCTCEGNPRCEKSEVVDLLPAGERGTFTITAEQLHETGLLSLEVFGETIREEAIRRGLALNVTENLRDGSMTVKWRPAS